MKSPSWRAFEIKTAATNEDSGMGDCLWSQEDKETVPVLMEGFIASRYKFTKQIWS